MGASRHLPPMGSLRAFEAAARLGSFTAAARDLNITQSAVSQAVQQLESLVDTRLFERLPGRLVLTDAGRRYAGSIGPLLEQIADATGGIIDAEAGRLAIGCVRSVLQHWLLARLPRFQEAHPAIDLQVIALGLLNEALEAATECDIAVVLADERARPAGAQRLAVERLVAVASPRLAEMTGNRLEALREFPSVPCLGAAWPLWFDEARLAAPAAPVSAIHLREASTVAQAALAGQGIALVSWLTCVDELSAGRLVRVSDVMIDRGRCYWMLRQSTRRTPAATSFAGWLADQVLPDLRPRR